MPTMLMKYCKYFRFSTPNTFSEITNNFKWINGSFILGGKGSENQFLQDNIVDMEDNLRRYNISVSIKACQSLHTDQNMLFLGIPNTISAHFVEERVCLILEQLESSFKHTLPHYSDNKLRFAIFWDFLHPCPTPKVHA